MILQNIQIQRPGGVVRNSEESRKKLENIPLIKQAERALKITYLEAKLFNSEVIGTEHLLLAILKDEDNIVTKNFNKRGIDYAAVKEEVKALTMRNDDKYLDPKSEMHQDPAEDEFEDSGKGG